MAGRQIAATLSVLRIINLRALRRHALRALLAAISLGGGVAVVVAVMIEVSSVTKAIEDVGYRIAGPAPIRILGAANRGGCHAGGDANRPRNAWRVCGSARRSCDHHGPHGRPRNVRAGSRHRL
jgi:hypothetical protein